MKTYRFLASFRALVGGIPAAVVHESSAKVHGSFGTFLATQQHSMKARQAFIADMTGQRDPTPESLSVEIQGHFIPIY